MKKFIGILLLSLTVSCNKFDNGYPQYVSLSESYMPIKHCHSKEVQDLKNLPRHTQDFLTSHLIQKLGTTYFHQLKFNDGKIFSDQVIEHPENLKDLFGENPVKENCYEQYDYPLYSLSYSFDLKEMGIEKIRLNLILDKKHKIIKDIEHEKIEFENVHFPIDSVQLQLEKRNISSKNLKIYLGFDSESKTFTWNTYTVISEGSIAGPSCFPEYKYHFKMDSKTGKVTKISNRKQGVFN